MTSLRNALSVLTPHLAGQVLHQRDHGVLEESCSRERAFGDLSDTQLPLGPHDLQYGVRTVHIQGNVLFIFMWMKCNNKGTTSLLLCVLPVVEQSLEILEQSVFVLINKTHHGVPVKRKPGCFVQTEPVMYGRSC